MKMIKIFSQPLLLALVWLAEIRPITAIVQNLDPDTPIPPTVLGTMDIALISSTVAFLFILWQPPIEITTKLININTRRSHSNVNLTDSSISTLKVWLGISITVKSSKWINWNKVVQIFGGIFVGIKENSLISHEIDGNYGSSLIKDIDQKPYIHLFDKYSELSEASELEYELHFLPDKNGVRTVEIVASIIPIHKNRLLKFITNLFILILLKQKHEKHPVYLDKRG